jgi:Fe2+ or Zn2+ uptake regulation protein
MAIANPRIHVICGICGNGDKKMFEFSLNEELNDHLEGEAANTTRIEVYIHCKNCSSLTGLDELMKERTKRKK